MWGTWHIISQLSEKVGGRVPRVPHLIAPMTATDYARCSIVAKGGVRIIGIERLCSSKFKVRHSIL